MKTNRIYLILVTISVLVFSCSTDQVRISADDTVTTIAVPVSEYNSVVIANDFNAYVSFSETEESIEIEANENIHQYINAYILDNTLTVKVKNNVNIKGSATLNVYINTKSINHFKAAADSKIFLQDILNTDNVSIQVSADSSFEGGINTENLKVDMSADAVADLYGKVTNMEAKLSADAELLDYGLKVENLKIQMAADCAAYLTVNNTIDIKAAADCTLYYRGDAVVTHQKLTGDSEIRRTD